MLFLSFLLRLAFLISSTIAFPTPSPDDPLELSAHGLTFCRNDNVTIDPNGTSLDEPRGYTFTLALIPGFGDPFILATAIDFWKNQLSDESENDPIPNEGRLLVYPQTVYQVHLGQAGDRRLTYYHANLALDTLKVHFYAIREESYVALAEVRIWAGAVLEGRVTLIARRRLKGIVCDDNEVGIGIGDGGRIKEVARN